MGTRIELKNANGVGAEIVLENPDTNNGNGKIIDVSKLVKEDDLNIYRKIEDDETLKSNSNRSIVQYESAHSVRISGGVMSFDGFRFNGQYQKLGTKTLYQEGSVIVNTDSDLGLGITTRKQESWYGVFACANEGDTTITYQTIPFIRLHSVYSPNPSIWYVSENSGEGKHVVGTTYAYGWDIPTVTGNEVLICSETINGRPNAMSGRITTITSVGSNSLGFEEVGELGSLDYVLIAPDFDHYRYCGSFYEDSAEVRNIADSGSIVCSRGINQLSYPTDGSAVNAIDCSVAGYISPLASAVILNCYYVQNTTGVGDSGTQFGIDYLHNVTTFITHKVATKKSFLSSQITIPFSFKQEYWAKAVGITARTDERHQIYGWIED